ncbi:hypothetical protein [Acinetobacter stercoris]|uniref:DUF2845 domain-containing protein n=1 Tax=Acinetobacter stercoris TaxID=2126983 RepID=A0A2U3MXZ5_9GAMM|nr:hypothetical protein [Acinetobacter stercoris]SPL70306.1 hypothetical protein KPC_1484 [Acinetobacter stercoris]
MKKFIFASILLMSTVCFADSTTTSLRTNSGDIISLRDTESSVLDKIGKLRPKYYVLDDGKYYCSATEYVYQVDRQEYKIIICRGNVVKILWRNI